MKDADSVEPCKLRSMALSFSGSPSRALNAMDAEGPQNPLAETVFHTDIRITGIENAGREGGVNRLVTTKSTPEEEGTQERAAEMQMWWDSAIIEAMGLPDGYQHVAVLLIRWEDRLDDLNTREEVRRLVVQA
jgi:hypothetical protein